MKYSVTSAIRHSPYGHLSVKKDGFQAIKAADIAILTSIHLTGTSLGLNYEQGEGI